MLRNNQQGPQFNPQQGYNQQQMPMSPQHQPPQISISPHAQHGPPPPPLHPGPQPHIGGPMGIPSQAALQQMGLPAHLAVGMRHPNPSQQVCKFFYFFNA